MTDIIYVNPGDRNRASSLWIGNYWKQRATSSSTSEFGYFAKLQNNLYSRGYADAPFFWSDSVPFTITRTNQAASIGADGDFVCHVTLTPNTSNSNSYFSDAWTTTRFPSLVSPITGVAFNTPFKIPLKTSGSTIQGLTMPTFTNATYTDALGDIPSAFSITDYTGSSVTLTTTSTTNVSGTWNVATLGDGSFGTWANSTTSSPAAQIHSSTLDADFLAYFVISPVIKQIDYDLIFHNPANPTYYVPTNIVYTTESTRIRFIRFIGLQSGDAVPW